MMSRTVTVERSPGGGRGWTVTVSTKRTWLVGSETDAVNAALRLCGAAGREGDRFCALARRELRARRRVSVLVEVAS